MTELIWQGALFERLYGGDNIAAWEEVDGGRIINRLTEEGDAAHLAYVDLTPLPRFGVKGGEWGFLPKKCRPPVNRLAQTKDGALVARIGDDELLCLPGEDGGGLPNAPAELMLPRRDSHFCFGLCGAEAPALLARLCMLPPPAAGVLLQTMVASIDGLLLPVPGAPVPGDGDVPAFYWLADAGFAIYAWQLLERAAAPLGGGALGWESWRERAAAGA